MLKKLPDVKGEFVMSQNECGFQEVVDAIPGAEWVCVVTYNLSRQQETLLNLLRASEVEVRLITNIPSRFETYTDDDARERAARNIGRMFRKLDPRTFGPMTRILFCFRNHAKIIMTESVAYVGSANYAEESSQSWECGVIVRDRASIQELRSWVDELEADCVPYYGWVMFRAIKPLLAAHKRLAAIGSRLEGEFTTDDVSEAADAVAAVRDAVSASDRAWYEANESCGPLTVKIEMNRLDAIEKWSGSDGVWELSEANEYLLKAMNGDIDAGELMVDGDGNVKESAWEGHIDEAQERQEGLLEPMKASLATVRGEVAAVCAQIEAVCNDISTHLARIKNTAPRPST